MYKYSKTDDVMNLNLFEFYEDPSEDDFNKFSIDFKILLDGERPFLVIFDLKNIKSFNADFFYKFMTTIYENKKKVEKNLHGSSVVIDKAFRKILKLCLSIKKPVSPNYVCSSLENSVEFLLGIYNMNNASS